MPTAPLQKQAHVPRALQSRNDAQDFLFLQDYAHKLAHTQLTLEEICTSLHRTPFLSGIISAQDRRALQTACCCLNSLRIRVEALANVIEQAVITRQLQLMQERVQMHRPEDLSTENTSCLFRGSLHHSGANKDSGQRQCPRQRFCRYQWVGGLEPQHSRRIAQVRCWHFNLFVTATTAGYLLLVCSTHRVQLWLTMCERRCIANVMCTPHTCNIDFNALEVMWQSWMPCSCIVVPHTRNQFSYFNSKRTQTNIRAVCTE